MLFLLLFFFSQRKMKKFLAGHRIWFNLGTICSWFVIPFTVQEPSQFPFPFSSLPLATGDEQDPFVTHFPCPSQARQEARTFPDGAVCAWALSAVCSPPWKGPPA